MSRTVVVTGLGATTPLGGDVASTWQALLAGQSGSLILQDPKFAELPVRIAAPVKVDPSNILEPHEIRRMDRSQQLALIASREAWADAAIESIDPERLGVAIATGVGGAISLMEQYDILKERGASRVSPMTVPMLMPNGPAAVVGLEVGAMAGVHTPVSACASGAEAIGYGAEMIRTGRADVVVCGGTEGCIHPLTIAAFAAMRALSTRHDNAAAASRPFDRDRDGFVMAEGSAIVVLESEEFAKARGAKIYGVYGGQGIAADAHHIAQPEPEGRGVMLAINRALKDADLSTKDIFHVNAHATSTPAGDVAEAKAIRKVLGADADHAPVTAVKGATGHLLGGAGSLAAIVSILAIRDRKIPPVANTENLDEGVDVDVVIGKPRDLPAGDMAALSNSFGFGGHDIVLAFRSV
ncbi:MAG: beta-ketoacyl-[acyl-carrier-protein] synthase family protein [Actinomycetes bacterium]